MIGGGILVSLLRGNHGDASQYPVVVEHPEMVDSTMIEKEENNLKVHKKGKKQKVTTKERREKQYRRRSPLDEPV